jgi:hypothetical protein
MIRILRETHDTPDSIAQRLTLAGGVNRFGAPNFRAVWGWNRLAWIGGTFEDRDDTGNLVREVVALRLEPKYPQLNRWHIERWLAPETYGSPRAWSAQTRETCGATSVLALGPYPARGDYEHVFTLETPRGEFLQLTPTIAERVARAITFSRGLSRRTRRAALDMREARADRAYDAFAWDVLDDAVPAFHSQPFVSVV